MKADEQVIEDLIKRQIADTCNLENVIKIVSAVVAIGAGAFNGISEITGAAELAAIAKEAKAAAEAAGQLKNVIDQMKATTAKLGDLASQLDAVDKAIAAGQPDSVQILPVREDFEETIKPVMEKFPAQAKTLRNAVRAFLDLCQAKNEKVLAYNALFVQKATLATHRDQIGAQIAEVNLQRSQSKESVVPAAYLSFFKNALTWSKQNLVDLLYEETRAFYYHSGVSRADVLVDISDLDIGAIADTHARLLTAYDGFLNSVGRPYGPFTAVKVTLTRADQPEAFTGLADSGRMTFTLAHDHPAFANMTLVKLDSVEVRLPGVTGGPKDELNVAIRLMGEGEVRPVDDLADKDVLRFNAPPRGVSYRFSYDPDRTDPVIEPGLVADGDYTPLSPFTTWTLDFGKADKLNGFVSLAELASVELRLTGHAFGRKLTRAAAAVPSR
jgi:tryptophan 2,3-dioxygenase